MKKYKPTTPGRRNMSSVDYSGLTKKKPEASLLRKLNKKSGRGYQKRITVRHRGGGHKRKYRLIDFKQHDKLGIKAKVASIEYDPNRSAFIALLHYEDGAKRYILAPNKLEVGDKIICKNKALIKKGNRMQLKNIPLGIQVYNIEFNPQRGGQMIRSAGSSAKVMVHEGGYTQLKLSSGEVRMVLDKCYASIGRLSNSEHNMVNLGKAGRSRWMGRRPKVRGSAMNPVDHPHGGGENRQPVGLRKGPKTPWGKLAYGVKTRKKKKLSNRLILKRRTKKKKRK